MYEIQKRTLLTHSGTVTGGIAAPRRDEHSAFVMEETHGYGVELRLGGHPLHDADAHVAYIRLPRGGDEDGDAAVHFTDLVTAYSLLRQVEGLPLPNVGPTVTEAQREDAARVFEEAAQAIERDVPEGDQLAASLRAVSLQLIEAASRPMLPNLGLES